MARKRQVTRTLKYTEAEVLLVDTQHEELLTQVITVSGSFTEVADLERAIKRLGILDSHLSLSKVKSMETYEKRFGMSEEEFIQYAVELKDEE